MKNKIRLRKQMNPMQKFFKEIFFFFSDTSLGCNTEDNLRPKKKKKMLRANSQKRHTERNRK